MKMNRRKATFLMGASVLLAGLNPNELISLENSLKRIKPNKLNSGDKVAIIAPGTNVSDPDDIYRATQIAKSLNLVPVLSSNLNKVYGRKVVPILERVDDLHNAFTDTSIKAILSIRGGYGSSQIIDKIDYELIRSNPKIFLGYSDITALHLAIQKYSGIVTFHGPVMLGNFTEYTTENFKKMLFTNDLHVLQNPSSANSFIEKYPCRTIVEGKAKGRLVGGNLSLISSLMGTPYEIDTKDKLLFIEDVGEYPYRIDRMLTQLLLAGKLEQANGLIIGKCDDCNGSLSTWNYSLGEVLDNLLSKLKIPIIYGLMFGHTSEQMTIPYGISAEIDTEKCGVSLLESAVN